MKKVYTNKYSDYVSLMIFAHVSGAVNHAMIKLYGDDYQDDLEQYNNFRQAIASLSKVPCLVLWNEDMTDHVIIREEKVYEDKVS